MSRFITLTISLASLLLAGACSGDKSTGPAQTGTVIFRLDSQTCTGTGTIAFFLDGNSIGTVTLSAGQSTSFANQPAGPHIVGASETRTGGYVWPQQSVTIPPNGSFTQVLQCP
jgi:hypothetical protein